MLAFQRKGNVLYNHNIHGKFISVVIPCYNEEKNIEPMYRALKNELQQYDYYEILFVDDGSSDRSGTILQTLAGEDPRIGFIQLSRNFGHQQALKAGIDRARGDCVITMDADLQHDPALIHRMIAYWQKEKYQVVYTVRDDDLKNFKSRSSAFFYRLLNSLSRISVPRDSADFRLLDRDVADYLKGIKEYHLFLRGLIPWMGFRQKGMVIQTKRRAHGQSAYSLTKMVRLALHGITSFSITPLRWALGLGLFLAALAFSYGGYALYIYFFTKQALTGWTSVIASILLLSGVQLIMLGIVGEYVGKIFEQVKRRPGYITSNYVPTSNQHKETVSKGIYKSRPQYETPMASIKEYD